MSKRGRKTLIWLRIVVSETLIIFWWRSCLAEKRSVSSVSGSTIISSEDECFPSPFVQDCGNVHYLVQWPKDTDGVLFRYDVRRSQRWSYNLLSFPVEVTVNVDELWLFVVVVIYGWNFALTWGYGELSRETVQRGMSSLVSVLWPMLLQKFSKWTHRVRVVRA